MSELQQSTFFHAAVDSSEQFGRLLNAGTVSLEQNFIVSKNWDITNKLL